MSKLKAPGGWMWILVVALIGAAWSLPGADREKAESYVRMARVAEADHDWLRSLALYNLAIQADGSMDGVAARRQYVIDNAIEAKLDPKNADKIPDPTIRKPSERELKTESLVSDAQKAERSGNWTEAMTRYNEAAALNPLNFYLISRAQNAANKAGVKLPPLPKVAALPEAPPPVAIPAEPPSTPVSIPTPKPGEPAVPATPVTPVKPVEPAVPAPPALSEAELAQQMIESLVLKRVQAAFAKPIDKRIKELDSLAEEFGQMTDAGQKANMLQLLGRTTFTEAMGRLSGLKRPANFGIEKKIDAKNTYFYTPGGETYKLVLTVGHGRTATTNTAFITFRVGVVPGSNPAVSTASLDSPEGKKIIEQEKAELEQWQKNQGLNNRVMQGKNSYFNQRTEQFTLDVARFQAVVNSYIVEEGGVLMVYRTYSKRNPQLDRELKKIIGQAQSGF